MFKGRDFPALPKGLPSPFLHLFSPPSLLPQSTHQKTTIHRQNSLMNDGTAAPFLNNQNPT